MATSDGTPPLLRTCVFSSPSLAPFYVPQSDTMPYSSITFEYYYALRSKSQPVFSLLQSGCALSNAALVHKVLEHQQPSFTSTRGTSKCTIVSWVFIIWPYKMITKIYRSFSIIHVCVYSSSHLSHHARNNLSACLAVSFAMLYAPHPPFRRTLVFVGNAPCFYRAVPSRLLIFIPILLSECSHKIDGGTMQNEEY